MGYSIMNHDAISENDNYSIFSYFCTIRRNLFYWIITDKLENSSILAKTLPVLLHFMSFILLQFYLLQ